VFFWELNYLLLKLDNRKLIKLDMEDFISRFACICCCAGTGIKLESVNKL
jgi:hypothetical protein